jgi:hypothetical protein
MVTKRNASNSPKRKQSLGKKGAETTVKGAKGKKIKLIRDSFTMPEPEYELLALLKRRCIENGLAAKKSEILRAAVINFSTHSNAAVIRALKALAVIKSGRPPKGNA